jgi:hypothetical protein
VKLTGHCDLAALLIQLKNPRYARQILESVHGQLESVQPGYQRVLVLTDIATAYCQLDMTCAEKYLQQALQQLDSVEYDKNGMTRLQIVYTVVKLNEISPDVRRYDMAREIVSRIAEPVDYVNGLIVMFEIIRNDKERSDELQKYVEEAVDKISSPYDKALILLTVIRITIQNSDEMRSIILLKKVEGLTKKINIPSIADKIRDNIIEYYSILYENNHNPELLTHAIQVTKNLDEDEIRLYRLEQFGYKEMYEITPQFMKIKQLSEKIVDDGIHPNHISSLERLVRTVADRGKGALFFCNLSIFFRKKGQDKLSRKMIQNSIKEARIIRPLSRRAFIMCDIALKTFAVGCDSTAQEILDLAIDAATNIRQSSLRDEVFDELGLAIKIMQRM